MDIKDLTPREVFHYFHEVCQIPRPSKHEEQIRRYLIDFGHQHGLETMVDEAGNVKISKGATPGYEKKKTVILQSHMDMVCEKNHDVDHDFMTDPIETYVDGEWLKAKGTTLGADNGIGVATELALLASDHIEHGPIECVFTVDEETGLTGAFRMKDDFMRGDILINLDSEDEGEMFIGCAGGANTVATYRYTTSGVAPDLYFFSVQVKGLTGGHSGDDINKGRANANKLLVRFLTMLSNKFTLVLSSIEGGNLHNAIPREAKALCAVPMSHKEEVRVLLNLYLADLKNEFGDIEPNLDVALESEQAAQSAFEPAFTRRLLRSLYAVHNGVHAMSHDMPGLVETSSNLASIKMKDDHAIEVVTSQRSSIESSREDMSEMVRSAFLLGEAEVVTNDGYPGWKPNPHSPIVEVVVESYKRLFGHEPKVKAIHAGLECGLFLKKYPHLDMVSFGPTLRGVHSPDERMLIPTVQKYWDHLLDVLKHIPEA